MARLKQLIHEVHRRSLWQVLAIYIATGWVAFEIVQTVTEGLGLPPWFPAFAALLLLIGLPIVLATAFVQEGMTPTRPDDPTLMPAREGESADRPEERTGVRRLFTWRNAIAGGVLALALWGVLATGWYLLYGGAAAEVRAPGRKAIAVLPFENLSPDAENAYFAAGLHEDILSQLAKIRDLMVISRTSVLQYAEAEKPISEIAAELSVDVILEGSVRRAGDQVRVVTQLIDAERDAHVWSETYDRQLTVASIFEIQTEIAERVSSALQAELTPDERRRIATPPTGNARAYEAYLRGNEHYRRGDELRDDYLAAEQLYRRAISLDPEFAQAYARLSQVHSGFYHFGWDRTQDRLDQALEAAERALGLEPGLPEGHFALGLYHYWGFRDYDKALAELDVAERGLPGDAYIKLLKGAIRKRQGEFEEARSLFKRAAQLDPRESDSWTEIAITLEKERRYEEAAAYYDSALAVAPDEFALYVSRARLSLYERGVTAALRSALDEIPEGFDPSGAVTFQRWRVEFFDRNFEAALEALETAPGRVQEAQASYSPWSLFRGFTHLATGDTVRAHAAFDSARRTLEARVQANPEDKRPYGALGLAYAGLGEREDALRAARRAVQLMPFSVDVLRAEGPTLALFRTYALLGDAEAATRVLEEYLSGPGAWSAAGLARDPRLDAIRGDTRFQATLVK